MNRHLPELLQQTVPEPPHRLNPSFVLAAARRRRARRRSMTTAVVAAVVAAVAAPLALQQDGPGGQLAVGEVPLTVSALEQRLPLGRIALGALDDVAPLVHPGEGALVGVVGGHELWLVSTTDDELCFLIADEQGGTAGRSCSPHAELLDEGVTMTTKGPEARAPVVIVVAAPDGYTTAEVGGITADVRRNVALFAFDGEGPAGEVTIAGPERPTVSFTPDGVPPPVTSTPSGWDAGAAVGAQARLLLHELLHRAAGYRRQEGTVDGFLSSLPAGYRAEAERVLVELTDDTARAVVDGRCVEADLALSTLQERAC